MLNEQIINNLNKIIMERKTFKEMYEEVKGQPTPARKFIKEVAALTHSHEMTVRMWLTGRQRPDMLAQDVIAKHFNVSVDTLFPKQELAETTTKTDYEV